jgi:GDP-4-dehydro-6-deoxy-D-mannose reductase
MLLRTCDPWRWAEVRALVTGAAGFVGRHLIEHLESCGDDVVAVDRHDGPDLLDAEGLRTVLHDVRPDAVYHLGGWSDVGGSWDHPAEAFRANAEGTLHLLPACRDTAGRVLVVSSADIYGKVTPDELPLTEAAPIRPVSPYAASKVAADQLALQAWLGYGMEAIRVRAFNHLGPGQTNRFVAPALAERIARCELAGEDVVTVGNMTPRRDFTDVRDVARAYRLLVEHGKPGEAYNVCSGRDLSIAELAERLVGMATRDVQLISDPTLQRPVDVPVLRGDAAKLTDATGWRPEIPLDRTLGDLLAEQRALVRS